MSKTIVGVIFVSIVLGLLIFVKGDKNNLPYTSLKRDAAVFAFGDSFTYGFGAPIDFSYPAELEKKTDLHVINVGILGEESSDGLRRLPRLLKKRPALVILCYGANDILHDRSRLTLKNNLLEMIKLMKQSGAIVLLVGVPDFNSPGFKTASLYDEVAKETGVIYEDKVLTYIELHQELKSDTIHPNKKGYEIMADTLIKILQKNKII